jgi:hypothetical protein
MIKEAWEKGLTLEEFVAGMTSHKAEMERRLRDITLTPGEIQALGKLKKHIRLAVLTEDWCSDCLMNLPIVAKIAEAGKMEMRIFPRSMHPDLALFFEERGIEAIPVFWFGDEKFVELRIFEERPQKAHDRIAEWQAEHPEGKAIRENDLLTAEEKKERLKPIRAAFLAEMEGWYNQGGLQEEVVKEVRAILGV